jgi:ABC-type glycerol-3-phosphate transport system substrate-binding protein
VVSDWTGSEGEAFQAVIDAFQQKNPKVTVKVEQVPFDQTQALLTQQFAAGSPPDVAVALPGIVRTFSEQDLLLDLDQQWDAWVKDGAYTDSLRQIASGPDGKAYAVYFKATSTRSSGTRHSSSSSSGSACPPAGPSSPRPWTRPRPRAWPRSRWGARTAGR